MNGLILAIGGAVAELIDKGIMLAQSKAEAEKVLLEHLAKTPPDDEVKKYDAAKARMDELSK